MKAFLRMGILIVVVVASLGWAPVPVRADGPNLLTNPGFESPYGKQCCQTDLAHYLPNTPIDEVQVASGWLGWWVDAGTYPNRPGSCNNTGPDCVPFHRPEWREANCGAVCANRVHSGANAQKYFTFYSVHDAGMYQTVSGITPGARLRFSVYMMGWSNNTNDITSAGQQTMGMQVGIDPTGGTNPFAASVTWAAVNNVYDTWGLYTVEAVARGGSVTVFTRSAPYYALQHNDIYVDDASLVVVDGAAATTTAAAAPTTGGTTYVVQPGDGPYRIARKFGVNINLLLSANNLTMTTVIHPGQVLVIPSAASPAAAATPAPATGTVTYVVQYGDTLYRLARTYNTTVERLRQLNGLTSNMIYAGQTLIIGQ